MSAHKSVRTLAAYEATIRRLVDFRIVHQAPQDVDRLESLGLSRAPQEGDSVLPSPVGRISGFNSNGKLIVRKDLPKEPETFSTWRTWKDWHGNDHSGIQVRTVLVYPRERVFPPSEYLTFLRGPDGPVLASRALSIHTDGEDAIVHVINLFLELFGGLEIVSCELQSAVGIKVKRLHWKILPPGPYPFARAKNELGDFIRNLPEETRSIVEHRVEGITRHKPDFLAIGLGGFKDYVVFGFTGIGKYVLESPSLGNATYVFSHNWEQLSLMTKRQILDGSLQEERLIHNHKWPNAIRTAVNKLKP